MALAWVRRSALIALVLSGTGVLGVTAQSPSLPAGTRVRLTLTGLESVTLSGRVEQLGADSLYVLAERPLWLGRYVLALGEVSRLEVSDGTHSHAARGTALGALLGGTLGALAEFMSGDEPTISGREKAVAAGVSLGVLGAGVGALVGSRSRYERWVSVPLSRLRVSPVPKGAEVAVSLSL